jgi:asparagine synthase (glutamine-hydrolysing)
LINISLIYNYGFSWFKKENIFVKGYLFDKNNSFYEKEELFEYFKGITNIQSFENKIKQANGLFTVIIKNEDSVFFAVDRLRMFPIFYFIENEDIFISDDVEHLRLQNKLYEFDEKSVSEFLATAYVTSSKTLVKNIFQVQAGAYFHFYNTTIFSKTYYSYFFSEEKSSSFEKLCNKLPEILDEVFKRQIDTFKKRTVVIPLSGGFDSRLIAVMLKKFDYQNVVCYTYGRKNNIEISISKQVAKTLDFKWILIEYTEDLIKNYLNDKSFQDYFKFSANYNTMFFMQEYFAVKYLKDNNLVPQDSIFIPGHSGDFIAGSQLAKNDGLGKKTSIKKIVNAIYKTKYNIIKPEKRFRKPFKSEISTFVTKSYQENRNLKAYSVYEDWDFKEKISKYLINSINVYNFFGYEFRLPFWDSILVDFFKNIPYEFRLHKLLYDKVLTDIYFEKYDISFKNEIQTSAFKTKIQSVKNLIRPFLPSKMKQKLLEKNDIIFYKNITEKMIDDLKKNGKEYYPATNSYNSNILQWYINELKIY